MSAREDSAMEDLDPAQHSGGVGPAAAAFQLQQPLAIRRLLPIPANPEIPNDPSKFTFKFLQKHLKGASMTPCLFTSMNTNSLAKAYYAINRDQEPYLPQRPGEHGAKLSAFMVELDEWPDNIPLFVGELSDGVIRYTYFGTYRSPRWSDRLDYDRMMEAVPMHVKRWHAGDLARRNRPAWLHDAMKRHFWPLREGDEDAEEWMEELTEERVLKCFEEPDFGPDDFTLRLSWEYLECTGYDVAFYDNLVRKQVETALVISEENREPRGA